MIAMILLVAAAIYSFMHPLAGESIWTEVAKRVSVAATFATVAGYASRQAKIHLEAERLYRRMELELTSLSPYLAELEVGKRKEILAKMTEEFFGKATSVQPQIESSGASSKEISSGITDLSKPLENIITLLKK